MQSFIPLAFISILQIVHSTGFTVNFDNKDNCNDEILLTRNNKSTILATERVANGYCDVTFRSEAPSTGDPCQPNICFKDGSTACEQGVDIDIIVYSRDNKNNVKIYGCKNPLNEEWCVPTSRLKIAVLDHMRKPEPSTNYQFKAQIRAKCVDIPKVFSKSWHDKNEQKKYRAKVEGILVGCCLASIFLVVLLVMYFYYKAKPTDGPPDENVVKVKVSALTGLRETISSKITRKKRKRRQTSQPSSRRPSQMSQRSGISPSYEEARRLSEQRTELKPPEMVTSAEQEVTDSTSTLAVESETKPLCDQNGIP